MKYILSILLLFTVACSEETINLPDHKPQIDENTARIQLLEANDALQDLKIEDLQVRVSSLEGRMDEAEDAIDANEEKISELCDAVEGLDSELSILRDDFRNAVRQLRRADRRTRRTMRRNVRNLRRALTREIRARRLADSRLQSNIDSVESDLNSFEARQTIINRILGIGLFVTNQRISQLQRQISRMLSTINRRLGRIEREIRSINSEISSMQANMATMQSQLDDVESRLLSVVYPCGEDNSEEVLLDTQDGLVTYFQRMEYKTLTFSDTVTIPSYTIPGHHDKYCADTAFVSGRCTDYRYRYVSGSTIPSRTYRVGDTARLKVLKHAYLDVLADGNYRTTDGYSCNFSIVNGEVSNAQ